MKGFAQRIDPLNRVAAPLKLKRNRILALTLALLCPGALLLALPDRSADEPDREPFLNILPEFSEPGLFYSAPASFSLPVVVPLGSALGRRHLGEEWEGSGPRFRTGIGLFAGDAGLVNVPGRAAGDLPPGMRADFFQLQFSYFARGFNLHGNLGYTWNPAFLEFDPGDRIQAEVFAGSGFGLLPGASGRQPLNLLLGLTADLQRADVFRATELAQTRYGTIFLAPGLQLAGRLLLFEATLELPLRRSEYVPDRYRDRVRGNIGMKYYLD